MHYRLNGKENEPCNIMPYLNLCLYNSFCYNHSIVIFQAHYIVFSNKVGSLCTSITRNPPNNLTRCWSTPRFASLKTIIHEMELYLVLESVLCTRQKGECSLYCLYIIVHPQYSLQIHISYVRLLKCKYIRIFYTYKLPMNLRLNPTHLQNFHSSLKFLFKINIMITNYMFTI